MVAVVAEGLGSRVIRGFLGCPACEARFAIERGTVYLGEGEAGAQGEAGEPARLADETAVLLGAVLDLGRASGRLLLSPELAGVADDLTDLAERWDVVSLLRVAPRPSGPKDRLTHVVLPDDGDAPVLPGRFRAAALAGSADRDRLTRYARALAPLGRIAVLAPESPITEFLEELGLDVLAADSRVAVAVRQA